MPIMFCYVDPFTMIQTVQAVMPESTYTLCSGTIQEVCELMSSYYATGVYHQIVLKGTLAESVADQIRSYSKLNYHLDDINIEVLK